MVSRFTGLRQGEASAVGQARCATAARHRCASTTRRASAGSDALRLAKARAGRRTCTTREAGRRVRCGGGPGRLRPWAEMEAMAR
jgi:hypothetical protein